MGQTTTEYPCDDYYGDELLNAKNDEEEADKDTDAFSEADEDDDWKNLLSADNWEDEDELADDTDAFFDYFDGGQKRKRSESGSESAKKPRIGDIDTSTSHFKYRTLPVKCNQDNCEVEVENSGQLLKHLALVHSSQPYLCHATGCNQRFTSEQTLCEHIKADHRSATQWICSECSTIFYRSTSLNLHLLRMHSLERFQCATGECHHIANSRPLMHAHINQAHAPVFVRNSPIYSSDDSETSSDELDALEFF